MLAQAHTTSTYTVPSPNRPIDELDVLPLLRRIRRSLDGALVVPRLDLVEEQRFSAIYVGLVDLEQRLRQVARMCSSEAFGPLLLATRSDLLARATLAVELLEQLTALHTLEAEGPVATALRRRIGILEQAYGRALFA